LQQSALSILGGAIPAGKQIFNRQHLQVSESLNRAVHLQDEKESISSSDSSSLPDQLYQLSLPPPKSSPGPKFNSVELAGVRRNFPLRASRVEFVAESITALDQTFSTLHSSGKRVTTKSSSSEMFTPVLPAQPRTNAKRRDSLWATVRAPPRKAAGSSDWRSEVATHYADKGGWNNSIDDSWQGPPHDLSINCQLVDWEGNWAPAPVDWDDRASFVDVHILERIEEWRNRSELKARPVQLAGQESNQVVGEIAPHSWIPPDIDGIEREHWWVDHLRFPDVGMAEPWWKTYAARDFDGLRPLQVPDARIDPNDNDPSKIAQTADFSILTFDNEKLKEKYKAREKREKKKIAAQTVEIYVPPPNPYSPRVNIYLRPAVAYDMEQIAAIYDHYIQKTVFSSEMESLTISEVRGRWADIDQARLPYVVAVDKSSRGNRRHRQQKHAKPQDEHVVGFGFADDYNDIRGMYRYTVEVEIFVKENYLQKGIGRCLMDKLISVLDLSYIDRGGYEFLGDKSAYSTGGRRKIGNMIVNIPHSSTDVARSAWIEKWLNQWAFEACGHYSEVGHKLNTMWVLFVFCEGACHANGDSSVSQTVLMRKNAIRPDPWSVAGMQ